MFWQSKCTHQWEKLSETILPSGYEQMSQGDFTFDRMSGVALFKKKFILVLACSKCGKIKVIAEVNPGG
jgi:hypothetical protein